MKNYPNSISERKIFVLLAIERGHNNSHLIAKWLQSIGIGIDRSRTLKKYLTELEKNEYIWKEDIFLRKNQKRKVVERHGEIFAFQKASQLPDGGVKDSKISRKDLKGYKLRFKAQKLLEMLRQERNFPKMDARFVWPKES
ncbi:MAG: hypothetical protein NTY20_01430 [Candidatus Aenigmarchaeota archaeon]|nr:hypothetical protein [Candidatus Aenigmarchaeota archaeon]